MYRGRARFTNAALALVGVMLVLPRGVSAQELGSLALDPELARIMRFWTVDRFFIDRSEPVHLLPVLKHRVLAKASVDECYRGLETPALPASPGDVPCTEGIDKTNQAYIWGLAQSNGYLYFGTLANTHCLVSDSYLDSTTPQQTPYWVCAHGSESNKVVYPTPIGPIDYGSDWRPSKLYRFKLPNGPLEELSAKAEVPVCSVPGAPCDVDATLRGTIGIRSAGAHNGVVFFAGPALRTVSAINVFAFNGATGELLSKKQFTAYNDIRQWLVANDVLYTTVGTSSGTGGQVLRWAGSPTDPMNFVEVGDLDGAGAYLELHKGRLFISTWPRGGFAGIVRGPVIPAGGLTPAHKPASNWVKVWSVDEYEPDPIAGRTTAGGALASFRGELYWGTMHVPSLGVVSALRALCPDESNPATCLLDKDGDGLDTSEFITTALGAHRSIAIFRMHDADTNPRTELLYGEYFLPKFVAAKRSYTIEYTPEFMNKMGERPKFGASGFGNFWNAYTWTMSVFNGSLFIGTFDFSQLGRVGITTALGADVSMTPQRFELLEKFLGSNFPIIEGADVFRIDDRSGKASGESFDGFGNFTNYGMRTVIVDKQANRMFFGSANPMNLHPMGGWELIETKPKWLFKHPFSFGKKGVPEAPDIVSDEKIDKPASAPPQPVLSNQLKVRPVPKLNIVAPSK